MKKDVKSWTQGDVDTVMRSNSYKYDVETQKKVQEYFDYKYPGKAKYDATMADLLQFYADLAVNNNKPWFDKHKDLYLSVK